MRNFVIRLLFIFTFITSCRTSERDINPIIPIIPKPASFALGRGEYSIPASIAILAMKESEKRIGVLLQNFLATQRIHAEIHTDAASIPTLVLQLTDDPSLHEEGYQLNVGASGITMLARTEAGLFYGLQSLMQLMGAFGTTLPYIAIKDQPRFPYRGLHLDVGRHLFPVAFIKKYIDLMAFHKFNRFHWHLTEDQGWRIEIRKYPRLQEIAAFRAETVMGYATTATRNQVEGYDGKRYGGYYTQDEIRDVVHYAAERHITIIPEIELPGHAQAALAAYPALGCTGGPYATATTWGIFEDVYCAGKEDTFTFLQGVLDEVIDLFPGTYIHIGGDECKKTRWKSCTACQKRIKTNRLKDEHELQSYFVQRIERYLNGKGKQIIGWDEILEGGLAPNATVMSWRGEEGGIAAARQGHRVIMTPGQWCYFDYYQDSAKTEPLAIKRVTTVEKVYEYEPVPATLTAAESSFIIGAQGNVWTEYMRTPEHVEYMVYPRACALAEVVWSPKHLRDYNDFLTRMQQHARRLDERNVNYARHILTDTKKLSTSKD